MEPVVLTREPLDPAAVAAHVTVPEHGAVVTFEGIVRNHSRGSGVSHLEYEAYEPLALAQLHRIVAQAQEQWNVRCAIAHRLGIVPAGECSVAVAVSSPHRADAFEACRWLMESLKATTPIWKKEFAGSGAQWIEGSDAIPAAEQHT